MFGSLIGGGLTNSGTMPISGGAGGSAGPSRSGGTSNSGFTVGAIHNAPASNTTLLIVAGLAIAGLWIWKSQ